MVRLLSFFVCVWVAKADTTVVLLRHTFRSFQPHLQGSHITPHLLFVDANSRARGVNSVFCVPSAVFVLSCVCLCVCVLEHWLEKQTSILLGGYLNFDQINNYSASPWPEYDVPPKDATKRGLVCGKPRAQCTPPHDTLYRSTT